MEINDIIIRAEKETDYETVHNLVAESFSSATHTDGDEHNLVDRIRKTDEYIPELSLVAVYEDKIIGHIMMSKVYVSDQIGLALAPLAVLPEFQGSGVGISLVKEAHKRALKQGYGFSVVLGSPGYYSRFGYTAASAFGIKPTFEVSDEYFMVCKFDVNVLEPGIVEYSKAFGL